MRAYLGDPELERLSRQAATIHARLRRHAPPMAISGPGDQVADVVVCPGVQLGGVPCALCRQRQRALDAAEQLLSVRLRHLRGL